MIGGVYSESDIFIPFTEGVDTSELVQTVKDGAVSCEVEPCGKRGDAFSISTHLPFDCFADASLTLGGQPDRRNILFLHSLYVGDIRLIGSGTGTRLVRALVEKALEIAPETPAMHTSWVRLGAVNAINNAFPGRLTAQMGEDIGKHYGADAPKALEQMFVDFPVERGKTYKIWSTRTNLSGLSLA